MKAPQAALLARAAILLVALAAACLLLAGCESSGAVPAKGSTPGGVFGRVLSNPAVTVTGGQLYVAWQLNQAGARVPRFELARADQATGAIEAAHRLGAGTVGTPLAAGGWLWVTISTATDERLLRMNPADLAVTGNISIGGRSYPGFTGLGGNLAAAGGALWVTSASRLLRVSTRTGTVIAVVPLPGAYSSTVGASGAILVVSQANDSGLGSVQRRDPVTGALIASHPMAGVTAPRIGGVTGSGVWVAEPTGMLGYIERFSAATMTPDPSTDVHGSNGITVRIADRVAWVTEQADARHDYCADPATGRMLGRIPLPDPGQDYVSAIAGRDVYYAEPASGGAGFYLRRLGIPAGCRVLSPPGSAHWFSPGSVHPCPVPLRTQAGIRGERRPSG
jgi:hypothetical protein